MTIRRAAGHSFAEFGTVSGDREGQTEFIMKKILYLPLCCMVLAAGYSCRPRTTVTTAGNAAKGYVENIMRGDYESFVQGVSFAVPPPADLARQLEKAHAEALRTLHLPDVASRGGIDRVKVLSEKHSPDNLSCHVVVASHYGDGLVKTVNLDMVNEDDVWKIRETPYREIWRATTSEGATEVVKVRPAGEGGEGRKQFVKDINHPGGRVEVVRVLENGERRREDIPILDDRTVE
jgi:hypothetical protein